MGSLRSSTYCALRAVLIKARQHAGLTQRQLAVRLKRPHSWIAKIEAGERHVSVYEFMQIASALSVPAEVLFKRFAKRDRAPNPAV